jgi:hypothetical protein
MQMKVNGQGTKIADNLISYFLLWELGDNK